MLALAAQNFTYLAQLNSAHHVAVCLAAAVATVL